MAPLASSRCADPDCRGVAEPEQDGDHQWLECTTCGYAHSWARITETSDTPQSRDVCAVGVPEAVRRAASSFHTEPPLMQIGRRNATAT
jgi:hypothetical protein